ncbi:MAG: ArdC family protein, partial [Planctomycetaceae bacterium]|nr:ArdC family protein [Planctomycetaceae bacterium]
MRDLYQEVTDQILHMLEAGTVPWRHPIQGVAGQDGLPKNLDSGRAYRGVNVFLLAITAWAKGYESSYWLTYKQAQKQGGNVRKGEKSSLVVFWKMVEKRDRETKEDI